MHLTRVPESGVLPVDEVDAQLAEVRAKWVATQDRKTVRRMLLGLLRLLEEGDE